MDKIYLPAHINGLAGTGWSIKDNDLYCGYEDYGKSYSLPNEFSVPPAGYVGYWDFEPDAINIIYYVCEKFGTVWSGKVSDMKDDYDYPKNSTWYFSTKEEAEDFEFAMLMD